MSLVAYADSEEDSDYDEPEQMPLSTPTVALHAQISDEDDDAADDEVQQQDNVTQKLTTSFASLLPKPKNATVLSSADEESSLAPTFHKLPAPRATIAANEELEDEFLLKKAQKLPVKITIPALKDYNDVNKDMQNAIQANRSGKKGSGLLSILPVAKSEQNFAKITETTTRAVKSAAAHSFIPDAVKQRRAAHNTEQIDGLQVSTKKTTQAKPALVNCSNSSSGEESDADDDAVGDFFSLQAKEQLPEVSSNEINALVAKRAAKMAEASTKYLSMEAAANDEQQQQLAQQQYQQQQQQQLNDEAMQALAGRSAKRRRQQQEIQVIDIKSTEVLPDKGEWMRSALASTTAFQPTGQLVDEEPATGTRRKHQITYLAHMAKANEAELQAMWASNRQNRRATQSKYGF